MTINSIVRHFYKDICIYNSLYLNHSHFWKTDKIHGSQFSKGSFSNPPQIPADNLSHQISGFSRGFSVQLS